MSEQPSTDAAIERTVADFTDANPATADQLLPLLHFVQQAYGCVPDGAIKTIAQTLNISRAEVFGVVSFYDDFRLEPVGDTVEVCAAEACQALGCRSLLAEIVEELGESAAIKEVFCLGNCTVGPSVRIGDKVLGRATVGRIRAALRAAQSAAPDGGP
jgi:formate dehydrogenase subunit gamma